MRPGVDVIYWVSVVTIDSPVDQTAHPYIEQRFIYWGAPSQRTSLTESEVRLLLPNKHKNETAKSLVKILCEEEKQNYQMF